MSITILNSATGKILIVLLAIALSLKLFLNMETSAYGPTSNQPPLSGKTVEILDSSSEAESDSGAKPWTRTETGDKFTAEAEPPAPADEIEERLTHSIVLMLRETFTNDVSATVIQIEMIAFSNELLELYPSFGGKVFESSIHTAFPEMSQRILEVIASMDQYNLWLLDNIWTLNNLSVIERDGTIWEKRTELLGELARDIWSEELASSEDRKVKMQDTIDQLDAAIHTSMDERLHILSSTLEEVYAHTVEDKAIDKVLVSSMFFGLDSVQKELTDLDHISRQQQINSVRERLGFSELEITKMTELDLEKDRRWENGLRYMIERQVLEDSLQNHELDQKIEQLQGAFFPRDAKTINTEEQRGFFRYLRPRLYGRN